jgi:hypothetical protein
MKIGQIGWSKLWDVGKRGGEGGLDARLERVCVFSCLDAAA